ncbi:putative membrane protein [Wickerhamomyces ciferrii]|uniref:Membrane protein n=1 Tax=Wickerhamomyces ciferrii (strain ATCC 14091 / BCRC 22168 / CBS 111 / JCM 3599 / NBRC 0793 / NRRL Y-1031 F-60-10) TaxID=1206466 RepID=K0KK45_WICCF|nr:uncharacterized protein BN7_5198 [Wickerhamomyces ciferrii]CCH45615.1 putative membrane protein [Wickerhamomyces ciferrii]
MLSYLPIGGGMRTGSNQNQNQNSRWSIGLVVLMISLSLFGFDVKVIYFMSNYSFYVCTQELIKLRYDERRESIMRKLETNSDEHQEIQLRNQVAEEQFKITQEETRTKILMIFVSAGMLIGGILLNLWIFRHDDQ